jgi:hypothetical protein
MPQPPNSNLFTETDMGVNSYKIDPVTLVDEISSIEYYIGVSQNGSDANRPNWRIKKIWKDGTTWRFEFPDGRQEFKFVWNLRLTYTYTA